MAFVQRKITNSADNVASSSATFDSSTTTGNLLVAVIHGWRDNASGGFLLPDGTVTDNKGNTWVAAVRGGVSNGANAMIFYVANATGGASHQVTIDPTGTGNYMSYSLEEWSGMETASVLDQIASATGTSTTPATGNLGGTTSQDNEVEFAALSFNGAGAITVGAVSPAYTQIYEQAGAGGQQPGEANVRELTATTNVGASWSSAGASSQWSCVAATFKVAAVATKRRYSLTLTGVG